MQHVVLLTETQVVDIKEELHKRLLSAKQHLVLEDSKKSYNRILENLTRRLDEELGINVQVHKTAMEVYRKTREELPQHKNEKMITIKVEFNDKPLFFYVYPDGQAFAVSTYQRKAMFVYLHLKFYQNGQVDWNNFIDSAQHEISHLYEQDRAGVNYPEQSLYLSFIPYIDDTDYTNKAVAWIIYLSNPTEQKAYANGMYGTIMKRVRDGDIPIERGEIEAYKMLGLLYEYTDYINEDKNKEKVIDAMSAYKKYGWTVRKLKYRAKEAIKTFERELARTLYKCQNDLIEEGSISVRDGNNWLPTLTLWPPMQKN